MKNENNTLLNKAKNIQVGSKPARDNTFNDAELSELLIAWFSGELRNKQLTEVLGFSQNSFTAVMSKCALAMRRELANKNFKLIVTKK